MTSTPRAILGKIKPKSPRTQTHKNKFQVLKYTNPETASTNLEHKSPLEANRVSYGYQSQQMEKVSRLIMTQVNEKREPIPPEAMERISHLNISQLPAAKDAGAIILQKCGLEEVEADPNGNCQYYSVAMALLNRDCSLPGEAKLLETLTSKLKKGIAAAANHFFAEEFPHQNRVQMLEVQNGEKEKLTQNQSAEALQRHFKDIGGSKSQLDSSIDRRCWGSTTTLRMLAKILHRTIYMVDASNGVANAHFSLFTAGERVCGGGKFTTVKEKIYRPEEITEWVKHLQKACLDITPQSGPPLVIIFRTSHYNWLRFSTEEKAHPDEQIPRNNSDFEHAMDCNEDFLMEDTEATESHLNQEPPKGDLRTAPARLESESHTSQPTKFMGVKPRAQTEQGEQEDIEKYGGDRKEELKVFLTTGVHALVPAHRQPLRELDMTNEEQVLQWCMQYDVLKEVLANWQQELLTKESQDTFTPTPSPETPTSDSQWSEATSAEVVPAAQSAGNTVEHNEQHGVGRFKGDKEISTGIRQHIQELQSQWNQLRPEWDHHTAEPFPAMPSTPSKWKDAILAAPNALTKACIPRIHSE
ncbi:hypothetical protein PF010_g16581 [Phytophthora fragariae]|uniref:OTU domain-containing protein n=1 Tax=Phytophthora fragariae TaxID=53985 RepID=A0A6G0NJG6_9STRA|nr:hypothetical protein PF010_g16581 [Phytophthora fragariae]KAE9210984.1 hypothetical protein PF004_g16049 [Phytophthora fragariae]